MKKLIFFLNIAGLFSTLSYAETTSSIPNVIITDNPNREVTTVNAKRNREKAELNSNIKKVTSSKVDTYVTKSKKLISFVLDEIGQEDKFYLTSNREIFNDKTKSLKVTENNYELKNTDLTNKVVSFKYSVLPETLYLVRYNDKTKDLIKLYKWQSTESTTYINEMRGKIVYTFTDQYKPFEIIEFSKVNKSMLVKGTVEIKEGENININPESVKEVVLRDVKGEVIEKIPLINGNGSVSLDEAKRGIILKDGSSILNFGIGFEEGRLKLQVKGTTDASKEYPMIAEVINIDDTVSEYDISIKPAQYGFKVLNTGLSLDFAKSITTLESDGTKSETSDLITTGEIVIDSKGFDIKAHFINDGVVKLRQGEAEVNAKLESVLVDNSGSNKTIQVVGRVSKDDIRNIPSGEYSGTTELVISIDS